MHSSISNSVGDDDLKPLPAANRRRQDITRRFCSSSNDSGSGINISTMGGAGLLLFTVVALAACAAPVLSSPAAKQPQQQQQQSSTAAQTTQTPSDIELCREGCYEEFILTDADCLANPLCLKCWKDCAKPPPPKINRSIRETWSLHIVSMVQQDSLVVVDVAWAPQSTPNQCLVTWEVSGGGLMGNLLTESFNVQLSLWPETKYRVQVTCKNKMNGYITRSLPLSIDTSEAEAHDVPPPMRYPQQPAKFPVSPATTTTNAYRPDRFPVKGDEAALSPINSIDQDIAAVLPYEDDDTESYESDVGLGGAVASPDIPADDSPANARDEDQRAEDQMRHEQHTNFIFNWHARKNADISAIEPLHKPELSVLNMSDFGELQKPLLFGVVAGTVLLLLLLVYVCLLRQTRANDDKAALIEAGCHEENAVGTSLPPTLAVAGARIPAHMMAAPQQVCRNPEICSRNNVKV